jgi:hypothetical protein
MRPTTHGRPGEPPRQAIRPVSKSSGISGDGERRSTRRGETGVVSEGLASLLQ